MRENVPDNDEINSFSKTIIDVSGRNLRLEEQKKIESRIKNSVHTS